MAFVFEEEGARLTIRKRKVHIAVFDEVEYAHSFESSYRVDGEAEGRRVMIFIMQQISDDDIDELLQRFSFAVSYYDGCTEIKAPYELFWDEEFLKAIKKKKWCRFKLEQQKAIEKDGKKTYTDKNSAFERVRRVIGIPTEEEWLERKK